MNNIVSILFLLYENTKFDQKNCFFALCQNQEWGPQTANILISNEEIFLHASALY